MDNHFESEPDPHRIQWRIERAGRAWGDEAMARYYMAPGRVEMVRGQLFSCEEDRLMMLGLLLENVGADEAVRLGDPQVWRDAIRDLDAEQG